MLPASNEPGLQVKARDGGWLDVPCDFGNLIINVGDMLQEASNGYFPSTTHRVVNPEGADAARARISLPLFLHPRPDVVLSERHTAGSYLTERLAELRGERPGERRERSPGVSRGEDRVALVTGGGSGIGRATALALAEAGFHVVVTGTAARRARGDDRSGGGRGAPSGDSLRRGPTRRASRRCSTASATPTAASTCCSTTPAPTSPPAPIDEISVEDWRKVVDVNLHGAFLVARAAFAMMRAQDPMGGRIVNNGSISAYVPRPGSVPYTVSKHAITGLTRTLSLDGRPFDIACGPDRHRQHGERHDRADERRRPRRPTAASGPSRRWTRRTSPTPS